MASTSITIEPAVEARVARELERLRAQARDAAASAPSIAAADRRRRQRTVLVASLVPVLFIGGGAGAWWQYRAQLIGAGSGVTAVAARAGHAVVEAFNGGVARLFGGQGRSDAPAPPPPASKHRRLTPRPAAVSAAPDGASAELDTPPIPADPVPSEILTSADDLSAVPGLVPGTVGAAPAPDRIYTVEDATVTPPVLLPPVLGRITTDTNEISGDMDVVVGRNGEVERVTLLPPDHFQDRIMIFAIKNRRFKPASLNGHPVRYLVRIRTSSSRG